MKKFLSIMLTLAMILSFCFAPNTVIAEDTEVVLGTFDFTDTQDSTQIPDIHNTGTGWSVQDGALKCVGGFWSGPNGWSFKEQTSGKLRISFDFMNNDETTGCGDDHIILTKSTTVDGFAATNLSLLAFMNADWQNQIGVANGVNNSGNLGKTVVGSWYTYTAYVDMDNGSVTASVVVKTPAESSSETAGDIVGAATVETATTATCRSGYPKGETFNTLGFVGHFNDFYMDNVKIETVEEDMYLLLADDFSSTAVTAAHINNGDGSYNVVDGALTRTLKWTNNYGLTFKEQTEGALEITYDFKVSELNQGVIGGIGTTVGDVAHNVLAPLYMHNANGGYTMSAGRFANNQGPIPAPTKNTWYSVKAIVDLDNKNMTTVVTNRETGELLGADVNTGMQLTDGYWHGWSRDEDIGYNLFLTVGAVSGYNTLDNVKIKKVNPAVLLDDDFSSALVTATHLNNGEGSYSVEDGVLKRTTQWSNQYGLKFAGKSAGKLNLSFDFKLSQLSQCVIGGIGTTGGNVAENVLAPLYMHNANGGYTMSAGRHANATAPIPAPEVDVWYTCNSVIDLTNKSMTTTVINRETGKMLGSDINTGMEAADGFWHGWSRDAEVSYDLFLTVGAGSGYNTIDNVKVVYAYDEMNLSEESIMITDATGIVEEDWTKILPMAGTIAIDFGTTMNEATMTSEYIYLADDTGEKVPATVSYTEGIAVMVFEDGTNLGSQKTYSLNIDGDVANADGTTLGEDKVYYITTDKQILSADFGTVSTQDNQIMVTVNYQNTKSDDIYPKFVVAYYSEAGALVKCDVVDIYKFFGNKLSASVEFTYEKDTAVGASKVQLFIWEDFSNIAPISTILDI